MIPQPILDIASEYGKEFRYDKNSPSWIISGHHNKIDDNIKRDIQEKGFTITEDHDFTYGFSQYRYKFSNNNNSLNA